MANKKFTVNVEVEQEPSKTMRLHESFASGEMDGKKFTVERGVPGGALVLKFEGEEHAYTCGPRAIVDAMMSAREEALKADKS